MRKILNFSASTISVAIINFLSLMIFSRIFNTESYGEANLIISYAIILSTIISFSVDQVLIHYFYKVDIKSIIKNFLKVYLLVMVIIIILGLILLFITNIDILKFLLIVLYSNCLVLNKIYTTIYRMNGDSKFYFFQTFGIKLLELSLILIAFKLLTKSFEILVIPFILSVFIISFLQLNSIKVRLNNSENKVDFSFKEQMIFSVPLLFSVLVTTLSQNTDKVILNFFVTKSDLGIYFFSFKLIGVLTIIYTIISLIWVPKAVKINSQEFENDFYKTSIRVFQIIGITILLGYLLLKKYIPFILGGNFHNSLSLIDILISIPIFMIISEPYSTYITVNRKTKYHLFIAVITLVLNCILTTIAAYFYGINGVAYSLFIIYVTIYYLRRYFTKKNSIKLLSWKNEIMNLFIILIILINKITNINFIFISILTLIILCIIYINKTRFKSWFIFMTK